ncbi:MAG: hypothetical protein M5R36_24265 [Deltaproteobacteria bacterium]|nr:hypothetical protein [Deltaproteobacteria bacterium]
MFVERGAGGGDLGFGTLRGMALGAFELVVRYALVVADEAVAAGEFDVFEVREFDRRLFSRGRECVS